MFTRVRVDRVAHLAQIQLEARNALVTESRQERHLTPCATHSRMGRSRLALGFILLFLVTGFERTVGAGLAGLAQRARGAGNIGNVQLERRLV